MGRSGDPRKRQSEQSASTPAQVHVTDAEADLVASRARRVKRVVLCFLAALVHQYFAMNVLMTSGGHTGLVVSSILTGGVVTAMLVPGALTRGWSRWFMLVALAYVVRPEHLLFTLLVAETWVLHRFYVDEGPARRPSWLPARTPRNA